MAGDSGVTVNKEAGEGLMDVIIAEKPNIEEVDQEIVVVAGCALGFVSVSFTGAVGGVIPRSTLPGVVAKRSLFVYTQINFF